MFTYICFCIQNNHHMSGVTI